MGKPIAGFVVLVLLLLAAPVSARADADAILDDCASSTSGLLVGRYSNAALRAALRELRGELSEYSGCGDAIQAALRENRERERRGGGGGDSGGGAGGDGAGAGGAGADSGGDGTDAGGADAGGGAGAGAAAGGDGAAGGAGAGAFDAAAATPDDGSAGGAAGTPVVTRRDGFALPSGSDRGLPAPLLTALVLLAGLAAVGAGAALLTRRRR